MKHLAECQENNRQFDYIFGDLTDIPIHDGGSTWQFVRAIVRSSLLLLPVGELLDSCHNQ